MMRYIFLKKCHVSVSVGVHACNEKSKGPGFDSWGMLLLFVLQYIVYTFSATFCWSYAV